MGGIVNALNAAKTSITTQQKAIEVVGNNIANVNTPGYSRQTPNLTPYPTLAFGDFFIGQGVRVGSIERAHDAFLTGEIRQKNADFGQEKAKTSPLAEIEGSLPIDDTGLVADIDRFFDAWQELSTNPDGSVERELVIQYGQRLSQSFDTAWNRLEDIRGNIDNTLVSKVNTINLKLRQVADLNKRISTVEYAGHAANAERDQRDQLIKELAGEIGVSAVEDKVGMISLQLPGGLPLVEGGIALQLETVHTTGGVQINVNTSSASLKVPRSGWGGEFRGLLDTRDQLIPDLQGRLDQLAYDLATQVNGLHRAGSGLDGVSGRDFFVQPAAVSGAATLMAVAVTSTTEVAAGVSSAPGDNGNALQLATLKDTSFVNGTDTYTEWYGKITSTIGIEASQNRLAVSGLQDSLDQLENLRESTVGVSIEEEMINLLQYQKAFEASAKFLSTVDEMMDSVLMIKR
ncbi:flagellar hook-associated protein 1 FlgK [Geothermobacter ehrlichii]|uniref:Flagellar hook-associated protein 1 n=1 Tax=Geothermobacter ehrlichii TaxID=213224 RepID=A0A5D3WQV4_9BACT|nr:flagellar hook-associated protein FlgK [Geothermobacter ehrlichii]TYP00180.1 flagellar hook-associated protein 1 FlgK [Geothermobacter ehrlichii]